MAQDLNMTICPSCHLGYLRSVGEKHGGFSGGKAVVGVVIAGPIGLAAGALGKKKKSTSATDAAIRLKNKENENI